MWKLLFLVIFLSVNAQKLKIDSHSSGRDGIEISNLSGITGAADDAIGTYRLPNATRPELYLINLNFGDFHDDELDFTGNVLITIRVVEATNTITLHNSLNVSDAVLTLLGVTNVTIPTTITHVVERDFMIITITDNTELAKDSIVQLTVNYRGSIGTSVGGVYRGSYLHNGDEIRCNPSLCFRSQTHSLSLAQQIFHRIAHAADVFPARLPRVR